METANMLFNFRRSVAIHRHVSEGDAERSILQRACEGGGRHLQALRRGTEGKVVIVSCMLLHERLEAVS
jgi:hypothetical protein